MNEARHIVRLAEDGDDDGILELLEANPLAIHDRDNEYGWTALDRAAMFRFASTVEILLAAGADVNARDRKRNTALHSAACTYATPAMVRLLEAGAQIDARDAWWMTPIHLAVMHSNLLGFLLLLGAGARIDFRSRGGKNCLEEAFRQQARIPKGRKYYQQRCDIAEIIETLETMESLGLTRLAPPRAIARPRKGAHRDVPK